MSAVSLFRKRFYRRQLPYMLLLLVALLAITLTNCSGPRSLVTTPEANNAIVFGASGQPINLEPGNITDGNSIYVQEQIYDRLIHVKPGSTELIPGLATEWSASEDALTWTFKLRAGVKFHDGTPLDAEAVKTNFERWWDPEHALGFRRAGKTYEIWVNLFGGFKGEEASLLKGIKVIDPLTLAFTLKQPFAAFPAALSSGYFGIASPSAIATATADYGTAGSLAVGTGPYVFKEWVTGDRIVLAKNPDYWQPGLPKTDNLVIRFIKEPAARLAELRAGTIDFTVDLAPDQRQEIEADPNLKAVVRPSFNVGYLALNPSYKPLADVRVRQAIAHAINRSAIAKAFWKDLAQTDDHFTPPALAQYQASDLNTSDYNPAKAKQLLAEAGYAQGLTLELWYMPDSRPYYPTPKPIAEAFAADLQAVGIQAKLQTKDWSAYLADRNRQPGFQAFMLGWIGDYSDPDNFYYPHFGTGATTDLGLWQNDRILDLLDQGRRAAATDQRTQIYAEVDRILARELVRIPIVHTQPLLAQQSNLVGWQPSPLAIESFAQVERR